MTAEELQLRRMVVCASGLLYWGGVLIQARRIRNQIGRSPNVRPRGAREKALWLGWFLVILVWIVQPLLLGFSAAKAGLGLLPGLLHPVSLAVGLAMVVLGYAGTLWTYAALGESWRIGINPKEKTAMVSRGPYRWIRHPLYLTQIVMLAGAALVLPTLVSFATLALHWLCVRLKVADEESYLDKTHGAAYRDYRSRTGSLFPRLVRGGAVAKKNESRRS